MTFLVTLIGFGIAMALMAIGVMTGRRRLRHGCGESCRCLDGDSRGGSAAP